LRPILKNKLRIGLNFVIIGLLNKHGDNPRACAPWGKSPMILCLCKGISDRKIREMAQSGHSLKQIVETSEASTCCGACAVELREIVKKESPKPNSPSSHINPCS
jgi:bacterioferritin-associated ferredoxin